MANKMYNLSVPIKYGPDGEKTFWHNIGKAWLDPVKDQMTIELNSLPIPNSEGKVRFLGFPPKDEDRRPPAGGGRSQAERNRRSTSEDLEDEIPF